MSTRDLRKAYEAQLRAAVEPLGFTRRRGDLSIPLACGIGYLMPVIAATYAAYRSGLPRLRTPRFDGGPRP